MPDTPRFFKKLTRFNYWDFPAINSLLNQLPGSGPKIEFNYEEVVHGELSAQYQSRHKAGNSKAIFEYVEADVWAFRAPWVVQQIETWRQENTPESRDRLRELMTAYAKEGRGTRRLSTICTVIKKDQEIFKAVIRLNKLNSPMTPLRPSRRSGKGCFEQVAKIYHSNKDDVETIYKRYKQTVDKCMGKITRSQRNTIQWAKEGGLIPADREPIPPDRLLSSWEEVFQWLEDMAATLERAVGVEGSDS